MRTPSLVLDWLAGELGHYAAQAPKPVRTLVWDIESRSAAPLGNKGKNGVGARAYAEHSSTEVLCVAFALDDGTIEIWLPGQPIPETVLKAAADLSCRWIAHNAAFERAILEAILVPRYGWPTVPLERHVCTMIQSRTSGYPGALDTVAMMLGLINQKDVAAAKEVSKMWKPRKAKRGEDPNMLHWHDTPELRAKLYVYCKRDVAAERELHRRLPPLTESEQEVFVIDAEINDRGILIDAPLAEAASHLIVKALGELDAHISAETGDVVVQASKLEKLKEWVIAQSVELPRKLRKRKKDGEMVERNCLDAKDIEKLLGAGNLPEDVRKVLEIRSEAAQSAAKKIPRMLVSRCADGRVRNNYKMNGALTGRFAGEGVQFQSLKRPKILKNDKVSTAIEKIAAAIEMVRAEDYEAIKAKWGDVLGVIGDLCRSMIIPASGYYFIVGDFGQIEARVLAWLAGATDKLRTFRLSDEGLGPDIYCLAAEGVLGLEPGTGEQERPLGKVFELGLGYGMGAEKILVDIRKIRPNATLEEAERWVKTWREQNPKIKAFWGALENAALAALQFPGMPINCGALRFEKRDDVLLIRLPSGRELTFPRPVIEVGRCGGPQITFPYRPRDKRMYGGKWAENVTSAAARDLLIEAMKRLRTAGYVLVLHAHDEVGAEVPIGAGSAEEFERIMTEVPEWASGLPVVAEVFTSDRFRKG